MRDKTPIIKQEKNENNYIDSEQDGVYNRSIAGKNEEKESEKQESPTRFVLAQMQRRYRGRQRLLKSPILWGEGKLEGSKWQCIEAEVVMERRHLKQLGLTGPL